MATLAISTQQPTSKFMAYLLSQEADAKQQGPVENFGEHETVFLMPASTNNANQRLSFRLGETN